MNMQSPREIHEVRRGSDEPQPHMGASIAVYPAKLAVTTGHDGSTSAKTNPSRSTTSPVRTSIGREKTGASLRELVYAFFHLPQSSVFAVCLSPRRSRKSGQGYFRFWWILNIAHERIFDSERLREGGRCAARTLGYILCSVDVLQSNFPDTKSNCAYDVCIIVCLPGNPLITTI